MSKRKEKKKNAALTQTKQPSTNHGHSSGQSQTYLHAVAVKGDHRHVVVDGMTSPETLDAYKEHHPEFYQTVCREFENQLHHNRAMQTMALNGDLKSQRWGQVSAVFLFALVVILSGFFAFLGYPWPAATMIMVAFGALFGIRMLSVSIDHKSSVKSDKTKGFGSGR